MKSSFIFKEKPHLRHLPFLHIRVKAVMQNQLMQGGRKTSKQMLNINFNVKHML